MRFQDRDGDILFALERYDGVLAKRHLKALFWPEASQRAMEMRLAHLHTHQYIAWPTREHWRTRPIPEPVCWLGWQGALWLAGQRGLPVAYPPVINEARLKALAAALKEQGQRWVREPRWNQLAHDLAVVDVRLSVERAVQATPGLSLEQWVNESAFRAEPSVVPYTVTLKSGKVLHKKRGVIPDGCFVLVDEDRKRQGLPARARFLLEVDMGTHSTTDFFEEKMLAGWAYLQSAAHRDRFGTNVGQWLVVTTGGERLEHLVRQAQRTEAARIALFSVLDDVRAANPMAHPIWRRAVGEARTSLLHGEAI